MATTIATLKAMIVADASGLVSGLDLTKREIREAAKVAESVQSRSQSFTSRLQDLGRFKAGGQLTDEQHASAVAKLRGEYLSSIPVVGQFYDKITFGAGSIGAAAASFTALGAAAGAALSIVSERVSAIDDLGDAASRLGVSAQSLSTLRGAAFLGDVDPALVDTMLQKMLVNVGKEADVFKKLNLDVDRLKSLAPDQMFVNVANAINKLPTRSDKFAAIAEAFGRSGPEAAYLVERIDELAAAMRRSGAVVENELADSGGQLDDQLKRLSLSSKAWGNSLTAAVVGPLTTALKLANDISTSGMFRYTASQSAMLGALNPALIVPGAIKGLLSGPGEKPIDEAKASADAFLETAQDVADAKEREAKAAERAAQEEMRSWQSQQRRLAGMREELELMGRSAEEALRMRAAREGASFMETAELVRLQREADERKRLADEKRAFEDDVKRGEESLRAEIDRLNASVEDPTAAAEKRVERAAELRDMGGITDAVFDAVVNKEAKSLTPRDVGFGAPGAGKGSAAAREAVIMASKQDEQLKVQRKMADHLRRIADKKTIPVEVISD